MAQSTIPRKVGLGQVGQPEANTCIVEWSYATDGGAISDITMRGDTLPSGAYVVDADIIVITAITSGGSATIALMAEGAADINSAVAYGSAPWSTLKPSKADKLDALNEGFLTTTDRAIKATIGTASLTAGKFQVIVKYWLLA